MEDVIHTIRLTFSSTLASSAVATARRVAVPCKLHVSIFDRKEMALERV